MEIIDNKAQNEILKQIEQREGHIRGLKMAADVGTAVLIGAARNH